MYKTETVYTYVEHERCMQLYWRRYVMHYVMIAGIIMVLLAVFPLALSGDVNYLIGVILGLSASAIVLAVMKPGFIKRNWERFPEKQGSKNQIFFNKTEITLKGDVSGKKIDIKYEDIRNRIETDENIYLITRLKRIIILDKNKCSAELLDFLRHGMV